MLALLRDGKSALDRLKSLEIVVHAVRQVPIRKRTGISLRRVFLWGMLLRFRPSVNCRKRVIDVSNGTFVCVESRAHIRRPGDVTLDP